MRICFISSPNDVQAYRCSRRWLRSRPLFAVFLATDICVLVFWSLPFGRWSTDEAGDYHQFYARLRDAIAGSGRNPVPPLQAVVVTALVETAIRSSSERRSLAVPLTDEEVAAFKNR